MPTQIDLMDKPITLSNEFRYQHAGGDEVVVAADQGAHPITEQQTLKEGDTVDSLNALTAFTLGEARLLQFSPDESFPSTAPPKAKSKKKG